jgi:hypothetical protein
MPADDLLDTYRRLEVTEEELRTCQHVLVHKQKQLALLQQDNDELRAQLSTALKRVDNQVRARGE